MNVSATCCIVPYDELLSPKDPSTEQVEMMFKNIHYTKIIPIVCGQHHEQNPAIIQQYGNKETSNFDDTRVIGYIEELAYHHDKTMNFLGGVAFISLPLLKKLYGSIPGRDYEQFIYEVSLSHFLCEDGALFPDDVTLLTDSSPGRYGSIMCPRDVSLYEAASVLRHLWKTIGPK